MKKYDRVHDLHLKTIRVGGLMVSSARYRNVEF